MQDQLISIRPWKPGDDSGVWSVLQEGSYSNINSTFKICLQKPLVRGITIGLFCIGLEQGFSPLILFMCLVFGVLLLYIFSALGAVVYLYGSTLSDIKDIYESYNKNKDHHFWVAECNGEIAGTIAIVKKTSPLKGSPDEGSNSNISAKVAWLRRMAVKKKFRGLGIAKSLVRETIEFCKRQNYDCIFLITTEVHHAARSLYTNMGFQLIACKPYTYLKGLITVETFEFEMAIGNMKM